MDIIKRIEKIQEHFNNITIEQFEENLIKAGYIDVKMDCLYCGKEINERQAKFIEENGLDPYCDYKCFGLHHYGYPVG